MKKILFTGGGSAGHVMPNIALMEEILSDGHADVCYMGTDGIEKRLIEKRLMNEKRKIKFCLRFCRVEFSKVYQIFLFCTKRRAKA
jgi:UDP-N-acetylglucosamine:LPS N-acetylglucosamine transferase